MLTHQAFSSPTRSTPAHRGFATIFPAALLRASQLDAEFSELPAAPASGFHVAENVLISGNNSIPVNQDARNRLFANAGAPVSYLEQRSIDIQILTLNEHLRQGDFGNTLVPVLRNGQLFTLRSGRLVEISNAEVLGAVADSLGKDVDVLTASKIECADGRLELDLISPTKALEVRPGDVVRAGLHIQHSRYHGEATQVHAFICRLVCANGMTRRECVSAEGIVRTRRLPADHPQGKELLLNQVRRLTSQTWASLEGQLNELRATTQRHTNVPQLLRQWLQRARISTRLNDGEQREARTVMDRLLDAWRSEGAEETYFAAVNALTRVGSHDPELSARQRRVLSMLGGLLAFSGVHICPRCLSVLSGQAHLSAGSLAPDGQDRSRVEGAGI